MINAQDIKNGTCIRMDGKLYFVIEFLHVKPGKGNTFMRTKLKDVVDGYVLERRFNIGEKLEDVRVERRPYQYLYEDAGDFIFMNQESFEQISIHKDMITGVEFMKEGDIVEVVSDASTETVLYAEMPQKTKVQITYTEPGLKGDTATNTLKPATVETGATVRVPLFIETGETIEVDTRDGSYVGRVKQSDSNYFHNKRKREKVRLFPFSLITDLTQIQPFFSGSNRDGVCCSQCGSCCNSRQTVSAALPSTVFSLLLGHSAFRCDVPFHAGSLPQPLHRVPSLSFPDRRSGSTLCRAFLPVLSPSSADGCLHDAVPMLSPQTKLPRQP